MKREKKEISEQNPIHALESEAALCGAGAGPIWYLGPLLTGESADGDGERDENELGDRTGLGTGAATGPNEAGNTTI